MSHERRILQGLKLLQNKIPLCVSQYFRHSAFWGQIVKFCRNYAVCGFLVLNFVTLIPPHKLNYMAKINFRFFSFSIFTLSVLFASAQIQTKFGFQKIGTKKDWTLVNGVYQDEAIFQLINQQ